MRDVLVTAIIFGSVPFILWRPQIGVLMWVWISVMNPHRLAWGFAYEMNFGLIVAIATLVSVFISKDLRRPHLSLLTVAHFCFIAWVGISTIFALYPEESFELWEALMKTQLMAVLIPMLFLKKEDVRRLLWVIVISIGYYGTKGGIWTLVTGGGNRVWGPDHSYIADNNALAVAIVMTIPLMRYLQVTTPHKFVRFALTGMMLLCGVAVLGTYSRGALLAASAMVAFLWWKGKHKMSVLLISAIAVPFAFSVMPTQWYDRMETIADYQNESSANLRLNSWATMFNLAKDRPVFGGGFEIGRAEVYARYSPKEGIPAQTAHSIYFQALGEHGFIGLGLYLLLLYALWATANKIIRHAKDVVDLAWASDLSLMMQVSLIGFAVGGAFLSLVNFDVPYYLIGIMAATLSLVRSESGAAARGRYGLSGIKQPAAAAAMHERS